MEFTAKQISEFVGGRIEGDENAVVNSFAKIEDGEPGALSFLSNPKYAQYIYETKSSVILVDEGLQLEKQVSCTLVRVKSAYEAVSKLLALYESMKPKKKGVSPQAFISSSAKIGENCYIAPFAVIGDNVVIGDGCQINANAVIGDGVKIGSETIIYPNVTIYHGCRIGSRVILHSGCVIGADGFGFAPTENGYNKIPQIGIVTIEDDVEVGANTCIDRSTMGSTIVHKGVKLDNLVQLAHNTEVGAHTVMSSQVGIAGSTKIGEWCTFAGQAAASGHISVGNRNTVAGKSGVLGTTKDGETLMGMIGMPYRDFWKVQAVMKKLPEMYRELGELRKEIDSLKNSEKK